MTKKFRLILAFACALTSLILCVMYSDRVHAEAQRIRSESAKKFGGDVVSLAVANTTLEPGDVITPENVSVKEWLSDLVPDKPITNPDDIYGKEVKSVIPKGSALSKIVFQESKSALHVPKGHIAITLSITDKLGLPSDFTQGAKVDAYRISAEGSVLIATDMQILSQTQDSGAQSSQISLAVLPDQVNAVLFASASGDLRLVLPADDITQDVASAPEIIEMDSSAPLDLSEDSYNTSAELNTEDSEDIPSDETPSVNQ